MQRLKQTSQQMVQAARAEIQEISAAEAIALAGRDDVIIVDIRDVRERERSGYIPQSIHAPRGMLEFWVDPESPYYKPVFGAEAHYILHCASGWRSALATQTLNQMGFAVSHITEGFSGWVEAGGPVETSDKSD